MNSSNPWHRHVSPVFFILVVIAGQMLGFVAFVLLAGLLHLNGA